MNKDFLLKTSSSCLLCGKIGFHSYDDSCALRVVHKRQNVRSFSEAIDDVFEKLAEWRFYDAFQNINEERKRDENE